MVLMVALAFLWGLFQLYVIATPSRTVRWRVVMLAFAAGIYASAVGALASQQAWMRVYDSVSDRGFYEIIAMASYTVDPFIEEIAKVAPLFLVGLLPQARRRLGLADFVLLGAALGAGFGAAESIIRITGWLSDSSCSFPPALEGGGWAIVCGGGPLEVKGPLEILTSWLPNGMGSGGGFGGLMIRAFGDYVSIADYNVHLVWGALGGLAAGLFLRPPKRWVRLVALVPLLWVCLEHAGYNYVVNHGVPELNDSPLVMAMAPGGFGRFMPCYVLIGLVAMVVVDRVRLNRALRDEEGLRFPEEQDGRFSPWGLFRAALRLPNRPWSWLRLRSFLRSRRGCMLQKSVAPDDASLATCRWELELKRRAMVEARPQLPPARLLRLLKEVKLSAVLRRYWYVPIVWLISIPSAAAAGAYFLVGTFPDFAEVMEFLKTPWVFTLLAVLEGAGLLWLGYRLVLFYRLLRAVARRFGGQQLAAYLLGGLVAHGAIIIGVTGLILGAVGGAEEPLYSVFHISDAALLAIALDLLALALGVVAVAGLVFTFPFAVQVGVMGLRMVFDLITIGETIDQVLSGDDLDALEMIELGLAVAGLLTPFFPGSALLSFLDETGASGGLGLQMSAGKLMTDLYGAVGGGTSTTSRVRAIARSYGHARAGDREMSRGRPPRAEQYYNSAIDAARRRTTLLTHASLLTRVGRARQAQGDQSGALAAYEEAASCYEHVGTGPVVQGDVQNAIGDVQTEKADYSSAVSAYERALDAYQSGGASPERVSEALCGLGEALQHSGNADQALGAYQDAMAETEKVSDRGTRAELYRRLGDDFEAAGDSTQAGVCYERAAAAERG